MLPGPSCHTLKGMCAPAAALLRCRSRKRRDRTLGPARPHARAGASKSAGMAFAPEVPYLSSNLARSTPPSCRKPSPLPQPQQRRTVRAEQLCNDTCEINEQGRPSEQRHAPAKTNAERKHGDHEYNRAHSLLQQEQEEQETHRRTRRTRRTGMAMTARRTRLTNRVRRPAEQ